jgi:hypothetical protein
MRYIIILSIVLFFTACSRKDMATVNVVNDLSNYPQSFETYTAKYRESNISYIQDFEKKYFEPWHYKTSPYSLDEILWPYRSYSKGKIYGATLKTVDKSWFDNIKKESNFKSFDTLHNYGLTISFGSLRNFPTDKPLFRDPNRAGEGFPFDYNQNSGVHANEPLYLSHYSAKGDWIYVFTSYASGWLHVSNIQIITARQKELWEHAKHVFITSDNTPLYDSDNGKYLEDARIGMLLPLIYEDNTDYYVLVAKEFASTAISKDKASLNYIRLNRDNLNKIGNSLIAQDYGWGGIYRDRDCSSMLRDFFTPFGIWLPRNSSQQAKIGKVFSLKDMDGSAKKALIKKEAIAFETLLHKKGHIMLYLGVYKGEILIFHNTWGIKTLNFGSEGRHIVGKSVISTLSLGKELYNYDYNSNLLDKLDSFNIITTKP